MVGGLGGDQGTQGAHVGAVRRPEGRQTRFYFYLKIITDTFYFYHFHLHIFLYLFIYLFTLFFTQGLEGLNLVRPEIRNMFGLIEDNLPQGGRPTFTDTSLNSNKMGSHTP